MHNSGTKKNIVIVIIVLVLLALGIGLYLNWSKKQGIKSATNQNGRAASQSRIKATPSQPTQPKLPTVNTSQQGGVVDQQGKTTGPTPPTSWWTSSSSGAITLQQPYPNETIQSGITLSGTAKVSSVDFILTDSSVGQIAQGTLNVVNGKFSGIINFTPHAKTGTLQIYSPNPSNGAEENVININVNYN